MSDRYGPFSTYAPQPVGIGYTGLGCSCDPTRGQSCRTCADKPSGRVREMEPPSEVERVSRQRHYERWAAEWRARLGIPATPNTTGDVA